jgi:hypothetical protein
MQLYEQFNFKYFENIVLLSCCAESESVRVDESVFDVYRVISLHTHILILLNAMRQQWRDHPRDLDLHLLSFNCRTWQLVTHCSFNKKGSKLGLQHGECLHLDRDDVKVRVRHRVT